MFWLLQSAKTSRLKLADVPAEDSLGSLGWCSGASLGTLGQHFCVHCVAFCSCLSPNAQFFRQRLQVCSSWKRSGCDLYAFPVHFGPNSAHNFMNLRTELLKKLKIAKVLDMLSLPYDRKGPDCEKSQQTLRKTV